MNIELTQAEAVDVRDLLKSEYELVTRPGRIFDNDDYAQNLASVIEKLNVKLQYTRNHNV